MIRAQALVMAEYEEAFEGPQYGLPGGGVRGSGFVRAGGGLQLARAYLLDMRTDWSGAPLQQNLHQIPSRGWNPPSGPSSSRGPPAGPSAMGYSRVGLSAWADLMAGFRSEITSPTSKQCAETKGQEADGCLLGRDQRVSSPFKLVVEAF
jgi:hypothetical protein